MGTTSYSGKLFPAAVALCYYYGNTMLCCYAVLLLYGNKHTSRRQGELYRLGDGLLPRSVRILPLENKVMEVIVYYTLDSM